MKWSAPFLTYLRDQLTCGVYGTLGGSDGGGGEPGGQRTRAGIGWVDVAAKHDDRDVAGARQLERGGGGLSAGARYPGVVGEQHAGARGRPVGHEAVHVQVATLVSRPDDEPAQRQPQVRGGQPE